MSGICTLLFQYIYLSNSGHLFFIGIFNNKYAKFEVISITNFLFITFFVILITFFANCKYKTRNVSIEKIKIKRSSFKYKIKTLEEFNGKYIAVLGEILCIFLMRIDAAVKGRD